MRPVLFEIGGFAAPSYGFALAFAFTVGIALAWRRARGAGLDPLPVLDAGLVILLAAMLGSRLLFLFTHPLSPARADGGAGLEVAGLSMQGGVVLALGSTLLLLRGRGLPVLRYGDLLAPSVALGEAVTRLGCLLNGCCFGRPSRLPWAIPFPATAGEPAHPTQLYTALGSALLFVGLLRLARRAPPPGTVLGAWLAGAGALRLALDPLRAYDAGEFVPWLGVRFTVHQAVALGLFVAGIALVTGAVSIRRARTA